MIYLITKFHKPISNGLSVTANKIEVTEIIRAAANFLPYILKNINLTNIGPYYFTILM
jgi:hypothetical protein